MKYIELTVHTATEGSELVADAMWAYSPYGVTVILANITAEILCLLAPSVPSHLKAGGTLILSGIIESRLSLVKEKYLSLGLTCKEERQKGEWFALVFSREA